MNLQPISVKKGGGNWARHLFFFVKSVFSRGISKNREIAIFQQNCIRAKQGVGDLARHFYIQPISAKKGGT